MLTNDMITMTLCLNAQPSDHVFSLLKHFKMKCCSKLFLKVLIKICVLLALLFLFVKVYFINQVTDFTKGLTTVTTSYEYPENIEPPTVTICFNEAFKTSASYTYGINSTYDIANPKYDFPYEEVIYKLDRDFELVIWVGSTGVNGKRVSLHEGLNTIEFKNEKYVYLVDFVQTIYNARCTKITPKFVLHDFVFFTFIQVITKSALKLEDYPTGLKVILTSNDTWQAVLSDRWNTFQPTVLNIDFKETYSKQVAALSPTKLQFKNGQESCTKCFENLILELEKCGVKHCNPRFAYDSKKPMCTSEDHKKNPNLKVCGMAAAKKHKKVCLKPKEALIFNPTISNPQYHRKIENPTIEISLDFISDRMEIRAEKLITETHDFIGSLGGSLGMFFGFAIISWIFVGIDKIFEKLTW